MPARPHNLPIRLTAATFLALSVLAPGSGPSRAVGGDPPGASPAPQQLEREFQASIQRVTPSVVGLRVERRLESVADSELRILVNGTGTVLTADGLLLTNEHVIQNADTIEVIFSDGQRAAATLVGSDVRADLAVLRVARGGLSPARFADPQRVARGQWTLAVGNPIGLGGDGNLSVSVGIVSNLQRRLPGLGEQDDRQYADMIQTTAAIHPGNSGGPLFNLAGEMIGIVTAMHTRSADDDGIGFAIPLTPARQEMIASLARGASLAHGYVGLVVRMPNSADPAARGVIVERVESDGPAATAGVRSGDQLLRVEGREITGVGQFTDQIGALKPGARASVDLQRAGRSIRVEIVIEQRASQRVAWLRGNATVWRGLRVADLTPPLRHVRAGEANEGVLALQVRAGSPAEQAGLREGDVIVSVAGAAVRDALAFRQRVEHEPGVVRITVRQRGELVVAP